MSKKTETAGLRQMKQKGSKPVFSAAVLFLLMACCFCCEWIMTKDPAYIDLENFCTAPNREFLFGTDTMGRDIFSMIWYGGRISIFIGMAASCISAVAAVLFGAASSCAPVWADRLLMRLAEILLSIPGMLLAILLQAVLGEADVYSISFVIGITGWMGMAKVVRTKLRQIRGSEYILAARCMGGSFFYVLRRHMLPSLIPSVMFMAVMNIRSAIVAESALSFMGIGLPVETVTWGSMLSLAENALLSSSWWVVVFPGGFLAVALLCMTNIGNYMRGDGDRRERNI